MLGIEDRTFVCKTTVLQLSYTTQTLDEPLNVMLILWKCLVNHPIYATLPIGGVNSLNA